MIEYLHRWARTAPDRPAIIDAGTTDRIRYGTLLDRAELLGRSLAIDPGDRVATVLDRRLETIVLFWGIMAGGGVVVALDPEEPADQIANQCQRAAVRQCIADSNDTARLAGALPEETNLTALSEVLKTARSQPGASGSAVFESPSRGLDRTRVILFTSGTTGQPSGIRLTGRNLGASAASTIARVGANRDDRWLLDLPVFHAGGFSIPIRTAMLGATTVLREDFDPSESAATMAEYDVTGVSLVPTMLDRLLDGPGIPDTLEFVLVGGAATPPRLVERALTANVPVYPSYGMTETASGVATATPEEVARDAETVGRPVQAADVAICDDRRTEQPSGEPGEIVVSGAIVSPGSIESDRRRPRSRFPTGDRGSLTAGRLYVTGRIDDRIVTGGETVSPRRVESALLELETVERATVLGLPEETWGELVAAAVVPVEEADPSPSELREALRARLPPHALPRVIGILRSLPRTASGTIDRTALAAVLEAVEPR